MLLKTQYKKEFENSNPDSKLKKYQKTQTNLGKKILEIKQKTKETEKENEGDWILRSREQFSSSF